MMAAEERDGQVDPIADACIVGGGPAGMMLGLILARRGVSVTLLEAHADFDRDFRGDTLHPGALEIVEHLGLAEALHRLPHHKAHSFSIPTPDGPVEFVDFRRVGGMRFPYVMLVAQSRFLDLLAAEASRYPHFRLVMRAHAEGLLEEEGRVVGVRYRAPGGFHTVRAQVVVGADGRFSRVRKLAGIEPVQFTAGIDVLWFRLPRRESDPDVGIAGRLTDRSAFVFFNRGDKWQIGEIIFHGSYKQVQAEGIDSLRASVVQAMPELADRVHLLEDWKAVAPLSVESSRVRRWYRPGLLLIGDAAHVMSPVGGLGINYAIQDAVEAANVLAEPLRRGAVREEHLAEVQRRRELPTRIIQWVQGIAQWAIGHMMRRAKARGTGPSANDLLPLRIIRRIPPVRNAFARAIAYGIRPARLTASA